MDTELKKEETKEEPKQEEKKKEERINVGWQQSKEGYVRVIVDLQRTYEAIGILEDVKQMILDKLIMQRAAIAKSEQEKRSGDTMWKGVKQNKSFFNKVFKR